VRLTPVRKAPAGWLFFWLVTLLLGLIIYVFWEPLRSTEFILSLQRYRSTGLDYFFRAFTFLGDDYFFLLFFCVMLWCVDKPLGFSAAAVLLISGAGSNLLKEVVALPRPSIEGVLQPESHAFPSGHSLTAVTLWGYLAVKIKKPWFWAWAITAIVLIGFSRLILGFHVAGDVLGGFFLGLLFLAGLLWAGSVLKIKRRGTRLSSTSLLPILLLLVLLGLVFVWSGLVTPKIPGFLVGGLAGYVLEKDYLRFLTRGSLRQHLLKILIGLAGIMGISLGLGSIFSSTVPILSFLRYALTSFWITFLAPFIFTRIKLCPQEKQHAYHDRNP
jgi:membrane-associated phospholipid phosphatase